MKCNKIFYLLSVFIFLITGHSFANDGSFFMRGNQLIPLVESDISIQKEVLIVKRIEDDYVQITVAYVFYNPKEAK